MKRKEIEFSVHQGAAAENQKLKCKMTMQNLKIDNIPGYSVSQASYMGGAMVFGMLCGSIGIIVIRGRF